MAHPFATRRGAEFTRRIRERDLYECQMCGAFLRDGRTTPDAATVDHTRPHKLRPDLTWLGDNCRTVCRSCHAACRSIEARYWPDADRIAAAKLRHRPIGPDGWPREIA